MPADLHVKPIYPDPFRPAGLEFDLPEAAVVTVTITDAEGKTIASLHERLRLPAGHHVLPFRHDPQDGLARYANLFVEMQGESLRIVKPI